MSSCMTNVFLAPGCLATPSFSAKKRPRVYDMIGDHFGALIIASHMQCLGLSARWCDRRTSERVVHALRSPPTVHISQGVPSPAQLIESPDEITVCFDFRNVVRQTLVTHKHKVAAHREVMTRWIHWNRPGYWEW
jgi:hypothetical protein